MYLCSLPVVEYKKEGVIIMVLAIKLLVLYIKIQIFFIKHDDDMLGDIGSAVIGSLLKTVTDLIGGNTDEPG